MNFNAKENHKIAFNGYITMYRGKPLSTGHWQKHLFLSLFIPESIGFCAYFSEKNEFSENLSVSNFD